MKEIEVFLENVDVIVSVLQEHLFVKINNV